MGGRISWIMVAVALFAASRVIAEEPAILPVWYHNDLSTIAPGSEHQPLFQGPKERLDLPAGIANRALSETYAPPPVKLWENGYQGWRYQPAPILLSREYQKYYPNLVPAAVTTSLDTTETSAVFDVGSHIAAAEPKRAPRPSLLLPSPSTAPVEIPAPPMASDGAIVQTKDESDSKPVKKTAPEKSPTESKPATLTAAAAPAATVSAPLSKQRRQRRAKWSEVLQAPAEIKAGDNAEIMTLGELLERIHLQHGLPVRIDLAHVLPMTSMAEMTTARLTPKRSGNQTARMPSTRGLVPLGVYQTYSSEPLAPAYYPSATPLATGSPYSSPDPAPTTYVPAVVEPIPPSSPVPLRANKPVAVPVESDEAEPTPPVSAVKAQILGESADEKPAPKAASATDEKENANNEEQSEPHEAAHAIQKMLAEMLSTPVDGNVVNQPDATVETVLRQAFDRSFPLQALINASLSEELPMLASLSRATEWDLLVQDDGVLLTTRLNANLHKETRVYSTRELEKTAGLKAEDVARVLTRTVRPWSWKKNFPESVSALKPAAMSKPSTKTGKVMSLPKIDLSLLSLLFSSRSPLPKHIRLASDEVDSPTITINSTDSENVELTEEQLELLSRAWDGLFQVAVSSLQVIYHADPPTGVIEVLPGMLVISQSQGAHREIADLLEQLSQPEN